MQFATIDDFVSRFRLLDEAETKRANVLLGDASLIIATELEKYEIDYSNPEGLFAENLKRITCEMVKRVMLTDSNSPSVTSSTMSAGPYSQTFAYASPTSDLYLKESEKRALGISKSSVSFVSPWGGD